MGGRRLEEQTLTKTGRRGGIVSAMPPVFPRGDYALSKNTPSAIPQSTIETPVEGHDGKTRRACRCTLRRGHRRVPQLSRQSWCRSPSRAHEGLIDYTQGVTMRNPRASLLEDRLADSGRGRASSPAFRTGRATTMRTPSSSTRRRTCAPSASNTPTTRERSRSLEMPAELFGERHPQPRP